MKPWTHLISPNLVSVWRVTSLGDKDQFHICLQYREGCSCICTECTSRVVLVNTWAGSYAQAVERDLLVAYIWLSTCMAWVSNGRLLHGRHCALALNEENTTAELTVCWPGRASNSQNLLALIESPLNTNYIIIFSNFWNGTQRTYHKLLCNNFMTLNMPLLKYAE